MAAGLLPMTAPVCPVICGFSTPYPRHSGAQVRHSGARVKGAASPPSCPRHIYGHSHSSCPALCRASTSSLTIFKTGKTWMAGTSPAMTKGFMPGHDDETHCLSSSCPALCRASTSSFTIFKTGKTWMAGTSPAMTKGFMPGHDELNSLSLRRHARGTFTDICHARLYAGLPRLLLRFLKQVRRGWPEQVRP